MLKLINVSKDYKLDSTNKVEALKTINLEFEEAGLVSILGPSGCGKTTLLNIIGGLDKYTFGDLIIDDISTKTFSDKDWDVYRNTRIGFVFQSYNLIPHLTLLENVEMPLVLNGLKKEGRVQKAKDALIKVGLEKEIFKKPNQLSGGQMQRVAIARAIINEPEIILADEPTGALDSKTSKVVLDLLKEISKETLVIMVTHNNNLAKTYSNRIISMLDGSIISDEVLKKEEHDKEIIKDKKETKIKNKTSMSYFTSLKISSKSILTKKGRAILTAIASSVGIIGVGLVLSISNGFSDYITRVERATASNSPITISNVSYSYSKNENAINYTKYPDKDNLYVYDTTNTSTIRSTHVNNFTNEFLKYLEDLKTDEKYKDSLGSLLINYQNFNINLISKTTNSYLGEEYTSYNLIDPYTSVSSSITSSITSLTGLPSTIFHEMYGEEDYILDSYDLLQGEYPNQNYITDDNGNLVFETALVVDSYNRLTKENIIDLGLFSEYELEDKQTIPFNQIIGKEYSFITNNNLYTDSDKESYTINAHTESLKYKDENGDTQTITVAVPSNTVYQYKDLLKSYSNRKDVYENSKCRIKITGILRCKEDSIIDYMPASLAYTTGLKNYVIQQNQLSTISSDAKNNLVIDNFDSLSELLTTKNYYPLLETISGEEVETPSWAAELEEATLSDLQTAINNCFSAISIYQQQQKIDSDVIDELADYNYYSMFNIVYTSRTGYLRVLAGLGTQFVLSEENKELIDDFLNTNNALSKLVKLTEILQNKDISVYLLSYVNNYQNISSIILFPKSLTNKSLLLEYLDNYNIGKEESDQIVYSDLIGTVTNSLGEVINIISWVLIAFASISLVVSCIMTAIITYNSVLERTKEIGILRAVGARKKDVGRLFKSETLIIGLISGIIGIVITYIAQFPINVIINSLYTDYNIGSIANIAFYNAIILVILSSVLAYISGVVPARLAAKKDPVEALRNE